MIFVKIHQQLLMHFLLSTKLQYLNSTRLNKSADFPLFPNPPQFTVSKSFRKKQEMPGKQTAFGLTRVSPLTNQFRIGKSLSKIFN